MPIFRRPKSRVDTGFRMTGGALCSKILALAAFFAWSLVLDVTVANIVVRRDGTMFTNTTNFNQGVSLGHNWYFNNVRGSGSGGITKKYMGLGNGSIEFRAPTNSSKADVELLAGAINNFGNFAATQSLGRLGEITQLTYHWRRDSSSTAAGHFHPVIRLLIDADGNLATTNDRGGLVFERVYNGGGVVNNTWVAENLFAYQGGNGPNLWSFGAGMSTAFGGYNRNLAAWRNGFSGSTISSNSAVIGISIGVGSGWNGFYGGADNVTIAFNGVSQSWRFESVPEPSAGLAIMILAGSAAALHRRRTRA